MVSFTVVILTWSSLECSKVLICLSSAMAVLRSPSEKGSQDAPLAQLLTRWLALRGWLTGLGCGSGLHAVEARGWGKPTGGQSGVSRSCVRPHLQYDCHTGI